MSEINSNSKYIEGVLNVCVCVPSNGSWHSDFGRNLVVMAANFMMWTPPKEMGYRGKIFQVLTADSSMLVRNRHDLVKSAMKAGASHIFFLDSDMKFPPGILEKWVTLDKSIIAANATHRRVPVNSIAHDFDGKVIDSRERRGLEAVRQVGCAVMLIKREFFEKVPPPYFLMDWNPDCQTYSGEDIYFCAVAQEAGFDVLVDHDISTQIEHVGNYSYGYKDIGKLKVSDRDLVAKNAFESSKLSELFVRYSDKMIPFGTDKETKHCYGEMYDILFPSSEGVSRVLELGYYGGGSTIAFAEFFKDARVVGLDLTKGHTTDATQHPRVTYLEGDVRNRHQEITGEFDLIVDDASHEPATVMKALGIYCPMLADGGRYIIEDIQYDALVGEIDLYAKDHGLSFLEYDHRNHTGVIDDRAIILRKGNGKRDR